MTTTVQAQRTALTWPLARRVVSGFMRPGGPAMVRRAIEGAGLDEGARVVELAPGLGVTTEALVACGPRSWTGVEPDVLAAGHLGRSFGGPGRTVVQAPVDETGLEDGSATVVVADALLGTLSGDGRAAVLAEAARLLRSGGRVALHDITGAAGAAGDGALRRDLESVGLSLLGVDSWRVALEAAGLVVVGSIAGPLDLPVQRDLMREAGPRTAVGITREVALDASVRGPALAAREVLARHAPSLRSVVLVAEVPLILGMRRPRR